METTNSFHSRDRANIEVAFSLGADEIIFYSKSYKAQKKMSSKKNICLNYNKNDQGHPVHSIKVLVDNIIINN